MTPQNRALFEAVLPLYNKLLTTPSWDAIIRTGILGQIEVAFNPDPENPTSLKQIIRQEFAPLYDYNPEDFAAVHQMILFAFTKYFQYINS
jgi:hypothetical protein